MHNNNKEEVMSTSNNYPVVVGHTDQTVTLGFNSNGTTKTVEVNKTMLKGMARWASKRLQKEGAQVPEYGTKEAKVWAENLRRAAGI